MAHMVETMAYAGELPWHGLGVKVKDDISVDDMLVEAGLDWRVAKIPSFADFNGEKIYSDAITELEALDEQLRTTYETPPMDMIG